MNSFPLVTMVRVNQARNRFFNLGEVPAGLIPESIVRSWHRSLDFGVAVDQEPTDLPVLSQSELATAQQENLDLTHYSKPVMENLYGQIRHTSSMVILTDAMGTILHSIGDSGFVNRAGKVSLQPGGIWAEEARGTNAIGTCLIEQAPVVIHRGQHFTSTNQFLTCSASPIFDPFGRIKGALDVSSDSRAYQQHTMALARLSTQQIENQMFSKGFDNEVVLHFHRHPHFLGTFYEGIAVFSEQGRLLAANRSALLHWGIDRYQMEGLSFSELFDFSFDRLCDGATTTIQPVLEVPGSRGGSLFIRVKSVARQEPRPMSGPQRKAGDASRKSPPGGTPLRCLEDLTHGDPLMQQAIDRARKVLKHDIPILIEGESGTGKELFAQALHHSSPRLNGPFVALNCAAIPAGLIEAELFGYRDGSFTGAHRKGYEGRIRQADGGTLFLDEIGDMPLELQSRLLRVLQERRVSPLGGIEEYPVDFALICATNRRIRDDVAAGRFREDLYYRLNGLLLTLPPLRDRTDLRPLAEAILAEFTPSGRLLRLAPRVENLFAAHPWPGNIRQMHNLLRTAVALLEDEAEEIGLEQLPDDFLDQLHLKDWQAKPLTERPLGELLADDTALGELQQMAIDQAIEDCGGNLSAAARRLGIGRTTLYRKLGKTPGRRSEG